MKTVAETICELSREHCRSGGIIMGQNLEAVQNVCGTVPIDEPNVQIMPTCEAAGMGIAVGAALTGRPVIHVIRFASFLWMQAAPLVYYAAQAKKNWGYDVPLFVRVSSDDGIGPTHSGAYHSPFVHKPDLKVVSPMTPAEYEQVWQEFRETRQPVLVSEHRRSYANFLEQPVTTNSVREPEIMIVAISAARFDAFDALPLLMLENVAAEVYPVCYLDDQSFYGKHAAMLMHARDIKRVLIVDSAYTPCSVSEHLAYIIHTFAENVDVSVLGMKEPPGVYEKGSPTPQQIADAAFQMVLE